jgi:hypothetical protein
MGRFIAAISYPVLGGLLVVKYQQGVHDKHKPPRAYLRRDIPLIRLNVVE